MPLSSKSQTGQRGKTPRHTHTRVCARLHVQFLPDTRQQNNRRPFSTGPFAGSVELGVLAITGLDSLAARLH